jgi:hypothetical protein
MFCDGCGAVVQAGQAFCNKCGKQIVGVIPARVQVQGRVQRHLQLLGILWLAMGALNVVGGAVLLVLGNTFFPHLHDLGAPSNLPTGFLSTLMSTLGILVLAKSAFAFLAGWGLMQREPWARIVALVLAFISLFNVPFGTAVGVYTLWVLLPGQAQQEYDALVASRPQ